MRRKVLFVRFRVSEFQDLCELASNGLWGGVGPWRWGFWEELSRRRWGGGAHLVGQTGQQVEHKVAHPLQELLQRLERVHVQNELLRLEVDHDLVNVWEGTGSQGRL